MDYAAARRNMVETQLRPNRVTNEALLDALATVPRERFVPEALRTIAYVDEDVPIAAGRYLMEPMVLGRLLQLAEVKRGDAVLDIGCGTGYTAAVLARLAGSAVAVESDQDLASRAVTILADLGVANVTVLEGELGQGAARQAPYDVIFIEGSVDAVPPSIVEQLADRGRLVAVVRHQGVGRATLMVRVGGGVSSRVVFDAAVPPLPGFEAQPSFVF
ncbi:MAG TPA: protein-L-isoaspartate O-methyltransferase [Burkholderiales bacterium]|jgi:protein-L-isoaspartate(D-aspartate) O-methyltransferase|nr:protein-L-isoaspartate O-methyltransferase [Burkholderiales bacterium]